jgi:hypothetical protein
MYVWQWAFEETVVYGRTWEQFRRFLRLVKERLGDMHLVCFIHNASYEFQFLSGIYHFNDYEVFCTDSRKVLKFQMHKNFEFRCSYKLTNMSLSEYTHKMGVESPKQFGFNYSKLRFPWTPLTEDEILYCINDVKGLVQALKTEMEIEHNNLYDIPLYAITNIEEIIE